MISTVHAAIVNDNTPNSLTDFEDVFSNFIGVLIPFGGILLFVLLMYGGIRYITAGPNPQAMEGAKKTITYAIIGMVVLAMAFLILKLIEIFTGASVTTFSIRRF